MPVKARSIEDIRRKLRALTAVLSDPAATAPERANAAGLKARLEQRLGHGDAREGQWTSIMFRLGRGVKEMTSPAPRRDWTDHAFRFGRVLRRTFKG